nr:cold shock domain-containing protein C2 isoform X1 [Caretta caretta]XP_048691162.1 cold shock domain-containing protein C2 isoform X1 [Caretta caretta]XP_048691164.1 cold shock domain-containing protein C2 isoform X1 [Caretta caretta]XP_048691168.1 cold shock domain-containing protein C2 isoform X1 [Caretta caretta]
MSSDPTTPPTVPTLHSPKSPVWPTFPFHREGSRIWERGNLLLRDLPSPLPTKRTRTYSATARASAGPVFKGVCKQFSRSQGHGFITPENGTEDIFVHVSDIEGGVRPHGRRRGHIQNLPHSTQEPEVPGCGGGAHQPGPAHKARDMVRANNWILGFGWSLHELAQSGGGVGVGTGTKSGAAGLRGRGVGSHFLFAK